MNSLGIIISRLTDLNVIASFTIERIENFELESGDFADLWSADLYRFHLSEREQLLRDYGSGKLVKALLDRIPLP
jgi:hypothetical protein